MASARNILPHEIGRRMSWKRPFFDPQKAAASGPNEEHNEKGGEQKVEHKLCNQIYFVEPLAWMKTVAHSEQGQLNCPKCDSKLGSFSWIMGNPNIFSALNKNTQIIPQLAFSSPFPLGFFFCMLISCLRKRSIRITYYTTFFRLPVPLWFKSSAGFLFGTFEG